MFRFNKDFALSEALAISTVSAAEIERLLVDIELTPVSATPIAGDSLVFTFDSATATGFGSAFAGAYGFASGSGVSSVSASAFAYVAPDGSSSASAAGSASGTVATFDAFASAGDRAGVSFDAAPSMDLSSFAFSSFPSFDIDWGL